MHGNRHPQNLKVASRRTSGYGTNLDITVFADDKAAEKQMIKDATVAWTTEGVRLTFSNDQEFFVSAQIFTGGR